MKIYGESRPANVDMLRFANDIVIMTVWQEDPQKIINARIIEKDFNIKSQQSKTKIMVCSRDTQ